MYLLLYVGRRVRYLLSCTYLVCTYLVRRDAVRPVLTVPDPKPEEQTLGDK